ncbi:agamous-like MADS-box protein AGL80 [Senna tora]|uniref:Agamous-like MADS-box protein AGL80 n=1 Tax=Senna tora TaxID=362788 RepID=A0A834WF69_9FABA|nr:agamous-like MADS-box protein AGL80 [Senna tora]
MQWKHLSKAEGQHILKQNLELPNSSAFNIFLYAELYIKDRSQGIVALNKKIPDFLNHTYAMSKEKAKFEYIVDDQKRKLSFKNRERGIKKKAKELSVLCGVDVAAIAYNALSDPYSEVWPNDLGVHRFLDKYHGMPVLENNTLNQEELIQKRLHKMKEYLKKRSNENFEEEISQLMINYMGGYADPTMVSENALHLKMLVDQNLKDIDRVMEESGKEDEVYVPVAPPMSEEGLLINRGNENGLTLHHGMGSENWNGPSCWNNMEDLEYFMGFDSSEMPQDFQNDNYQNASSSNNPFYP